MAEKTGPQTISTLSFGEQNLTKTDGGGKWYAKARKIRKDPTIALAKALCMAPMLSSGWSVESNDDAPDDAKDFIDYYMQPQRLHLLRVAQSGMIDYGWQPFEKVFELNEDQLVYVRKFKPLLQDITEIKITEDTGSFDGFENSPPTKSKTDVPLENALLFSHGVEGTDWYGTAMLRNAEAAYDEWHIINEAARRYDKKIAGSHWVIHYPMGMSMYNGEQVSNDVIADALLSSLESSGGIKVPRKIDAITEDLNEQSPDAWKLEILSDPGSSRAAFIERQKYLDVLKVRALELPERSVIEGEFGTKAEAEAHANFAITNIELRHQLITEVINWHVVNQLLRFNWGRQYENTVYITPAPITDTKRVFLRELYRAILTHPDGFLEEANRIDLDALKDSLGVPYKSEEEQIIDDVADIATREMAEV